MWQHIARNRVSAQMSIPDCRLCCLQDLNAALPTQTPIKALSVCPEVPWLCFWCLQDLSVAALATQSLQHKTLPRCILDSCV